MSGVANMPQGITSIAKLRATIKEMPLRIQSAVAKDAVGVLERETRDAFASSRTVYDTPRPVSVDKRHTGEALTLKKSGATERSLTFVAIGTIVRASLGTRYAKYLIGKYGVLPQKLPASWAAKLTEIVADYKRIAEEEFAR